MPKKITEIIKDTIGKIRKGYDLNQNEITEIVNNSYDWYDLGMNFFYIGYAKGKKAAMSELKEKLRKKAVQA